MVRPVVARRRPRSRGRRQDVGDETVRAVDGGGQVVGAGAVLAAVLTLKAEKIERGVKISAGSQ